MLTTTSFLARDNKKIFVRIWKEGENPIGILFISHGMAENGNRYKQLAEFISSKGYVVIIPDHRGHGETDKETHGYSKGNMFQNSLDDLAEVLDYYKEQYKLKAVLFGHSYGSFLSQAFIQKYPEKIEGVILGGSACMKGSAVNLGLFLSSIGYFFNEKKPAKIIEKLSFGTYNKKFKEGTFISSIKEECERYEADKNCGFVCSNNFYRSLFAGFKNLYTEKGLKNIDVNKPILLISGDNDPVGEMGESVKRLYETYKNLKVKDVELILYKGVRHEYLNDVSKNQAFNDILNFLDKNLKIKVNK